jgi:hypothetical protein
MYSLGTTGMGSKALRGPQDHNPGIPTPEEIRSMSEQDKSHDLLEAKDGGLISQEKYSMMATEFEGAGADADGLAKRNE